MTHDLYTFSIAFGPISFGPISFGPISFVCVGCDNSAILLYYNKIFIFIF